MEAGVSFTISRSCFLSPQLLLRITISFSCIHSSPLPVLWHLHIAVLPECILFALDSLSSCSASPSLAAFTCWKTHLSPQCNCKPFVIASVCGCGRGRGSSPFFDTIKFPCRLILNARRILIIFIENALWNSSAPQLRSGVLSCLTLHLLLPLPSFFFPFLSLFSSFAVPRSAVLIGHLFPLWQTEVQQKEQATGAGKNECHSFIYSFIHSFTQSRIRCRRVPVYFAHAIKPGIGLDSPQLHSLSSSFPSSLYLCEPVKLITIYIVYRLVLRFALSLFRSLRRQINSMFFNSIFKYFTRPNAWSPRCSPSSSILPFPHCYLSLCSVIMRNFFNISLLIVRG